jgi:N-hydroxyarylamine O-acetyltransferase
LDDYSDACRFQQTSPDSSFTRGDLCTIALPDGRVTLSSTDLTLTVAGHKTVTPHASVADFDWYLQDYFGICL